MKKPSTRVTDHAIVRYLERVLNLDVERVRREIGQKVDHGVKSGARNVRVGGVSYKLVDGVVVTVCKASRPSRAHGWKRKK